MKLFCIVARYCRRAKEQTPRPLTAGSNMARLVSLLTVSSQNSFGTWMPPKPTMMHKQHSSQSLLHEYCCKSVYLYVCLSIRLSLSLFVCSSICLSLSLCRPICLPLSVSVCPPVYPSLSVGPSVYPSLCLSAHLYVCLCLSVSVCLPPSHPLSLSLSLSLSLPPICLSLSVSVCPSLSLSLSPSPSTPSLIV